MILSEYLQQKSSDFQYFMLNIAFHQVKQPWESLEKLFSLRLKIRHQQPLRFYPYFQQQDNFHQVKMPSLIFTKGLNISLTSLFQRPKSEFSNLSKMKRLIFQRGKILLNQTILFLPNIFMILTLLEIIRPRRAKHHLNCLYIPLQPIFRKLTTPSIHKTYPLEN